MVSHSQKSDAAGRFSDTAVNWRAISLPVSGVAVVSRKYFYAIGGRSISGGVLANLERYDVPADTWATLSSMPTARAGLAAAVVKNAIYAIGGRNSISGPCSGTATDVVEKYNIGTDTWSAVAPLPSPRSDLAAIAHTNGKIYVFGGCDGGVPTFDDVDVYDPLTNTWAALAPMPTARASLVVGKIKTTIFAIGGTDDLSTPLSTNEAYEIPTNTWSAALDMTTARGEAIAASRKDKNGANAVFVLGGAQPAFGTPVDANEAFTR